jgi:hypothetical protein
MFQWDKSITTLEIAVGQVVRLFRSMRDVQLALPGLPAQEATAYLCQYQAEQGIGTVAVFHLHKSGQLTFYVNTPREVSSGKAEAVLDQALVFVESMGFLMTDLDIHLLAEADREMLWVSLPLHGGVQPQEKIPQAKTVPVGPAPSQEKPAAVTTAAESLPVSGSITAETSIPLPEPVPTGPLPETSQAEGLSVEADVSEPANVDDLLAAVEGLRTRRPGVRTRKKPPSPEELKRRRQELCENLGRLLASL